MRKKTQTTPISPLRPKDDPLPTGKVIITPDIYKLLMDILAPLHVTHKSEHADLIKNVVLQEIRERISAIYGAPGYRS